ncbi:MAG TPA: hypothetical protein DD438_02575 [Verrucomicrobiales bacterium]|mgnify:FL=1|nr:hypothetical protein [Verrucomicrobiales bacterium]HCQ38625.1 hypothetical protein [Verrucomicrobiales bacterium]|tara:strand:+ start:421 stop:1014 length:594 start_codon:yes stop_codon:yes gene_type:complete
MRLLTGISLSCLLCLTAWGEPGKSRGPSSLSHLKLVDVTGAVHEPAKSAKTIAAVFVYVDTTCPIANFYQPTLRRLARTFEAQGIRFFQLHPDPDGEKEDLTRHASEFEVISPVILDNKQRYARLHNAKVTPEAHVYLRDGTCVYRGRIDDTYTTYGKRRPSPTTHDLRDALSAIISGSKVTNPETKAIGCQILIEK